MVDVFDVWIWVVGNCLVLLSWKNYWSQRLPSISFPNRSSDIIWESVSAMKQFSKARVQKCFKILKPHEIFRGQQCYMKRVPYREPTNIPSHHTKFSTSREPAPGACAPPPSLHKYVSEFLSQIKNWHWECRLFVTGSTETVEEGWVCAPTFWQWPCPADVWEIVRILLSTSGYWTAQRSLEQKRVKVMKFHFDLCTVKMGLHLYVA